jgi:hypothetical protein
LNLVFEFTDSPVPTVARVTAPEVRWTAGRGYTEFTGEGALEGAPGRETLQSELEPELGKA